jgi:hypothetical protein
LAQAVTNGKLTHVQENQILQNINSGNGSPSSRTSDNISSRQHLSRLNKTPSRKPATLPMQLLAFLLSGRPRSKFASFFRAGIVQAGASLA